MPPSGGRRERWLSLRNSINEPKCFTFRINNTQFNGTILIEPDGIINVFQGEKGQIYDIAIETENTERESYCWEIEEGNESLVAELTREEFRFKEINIL